LAQGSLPLLQMLCVAHAGPYQTRRPLFFVAKRPYLYSFSRLSAIMETWLSAAGWRAQPALYDEEQAFQARGGALRD